MNCLIVDDEVLAQDVLALYISRVDSLNLVGRCSNALQAFAALNKEDVDIMFLDIKMPEMSGLDLIKSLKHPPRIILTTAFETYALEGYERAYQSSCVLPLWELDLAPGETWEVEIGFKLVEL